jgi:hypothetical protein
MRRSRIASFSFVLKRGSGQNLIAEIPAQIASSSQIDLTSRLFRKLQFHSDDIEQSRYITWFKLNEDIDIARRAESRRQNGTG